MRFHRSETVGCWKGELTRHSAALLERWRDVDQIEPDYCIAVMA